MGLLRLVITSFTSVLPHYPPFLNLLSTEVLCNLTLLVFNQHVDALIFGDIMAIFVAVTKHMRAFFKKELELFFEKVVFHILGSISVYRQLERFVIERLLLQSLYEVFSQENTIEEFFRNYDCDPYSLNIVSILFSIVRVVSHTDS